MRVEGYAVGEDKRHINSAFFTFRPVDTDCQLPELVTDTEVCSYNNNYYSGSRNNVATCMYENHH